MAVVVDPLGTGLVVDVSGIGLGGAEPGQRCVEGSSVRGLAVDASSLGLSARAPATCS